MHHVPRGWTLVELMLALAILGVLSGIAVSSYGAAIQSGRSFAAHADLVAAINAARTSAIARQVDVRMCPSTDGATCADSTHWETGWIVYADLNDNNRKDDSDQLVGGHARLDDGVRLVTSTGRRTIEFQPNGGNDGSNATFTICDRRGPPQAKAWAMSNPGTLRPVPPTATAIVDACYP